MGQYNQQRQTAFTLIELLIVITIIAILAAILFPVFARAREKGRQAACTANLRQIGIATLSYAQDNDEVFPSDVTNGSSAPNGNWAYELNIYTKATGIYHCPNDGNIPTATTIPYSYGYNANLAGQNSAKFASPAVVVVYYEDGSSASGNPTLQTDASAPDGVDPYPTNTGVGYVAQMNTSAVGMGIGGCALQSGPTRHDPGAEYVCADAHVRFLMPTQVSVGGLGTAPTMNTTQTCSSASSKGGVAAGSAAIAGTYTLTFSYL